MLSIATIASTTSNPHSPPLVSWSVWFRPQFPTPHQSIFWTHPLFDYSRLYEVPLKDLTSFPLYLVGSWEEFTFWIAFPLLLFILSLFDFLDFRSFFLSRLFYLFVNQDPQSVLVLSPIIFVLSPGSKPPFSFPFPSFLLFLISEGKYHWCNHPEKSGKNKK